MEGEGAAAPVHDICVGDGLDAQVQGVEEAAAGGIAAGERAPEQHPPGFLLRHERVRAHVAVPEEAPAAAERPRTHLPACARTWSHVR